MKQTPSYLHVQQRQHWYSTFVVKLMNPVPSPLSSVHRLLSKGNLQFVCADTDKQHITENSEQIKYEPHSHGVSLQLNTLEIQGQQVSSMSSRSVGL